MDRLFTIKLSTLFGIIVLIGVILLIIVQSEYRLTIDSSLEEPEVKEVMFLPSGFLIKNEEPKAVLVAVGDIMLSRMVARRIKENQDQKYPFLEVSDLIGQADIAFGNLECPITPGRNINLFEMVFRADPESVNGLKYAGFDILSLANNHIFNFGQEGLTDTFSYLEKANIDYIGAGKNKQEAHNFKMLEVNGIKFAFLAYADSIFSYTFSQTEESQPSIALMDVVQMKKDIFSIKNQADFIIVSMHSGIEYVSQPNAKQIEFAHAAVDTGADLVIGHHPHVVQKMEQYKGGYIFYSLGNFIFDQMWSRETRESVIAKIVFGENNIQEIDFIPILIEDFAQPRILDIQESKDIFDKLNVPFQSRYIFYWDGQDYQYKNENSVYLTRKAKKFIEQEIDLDNDERLENIILRQNMVQVLRDNKLLWKSDPNWQVEDVVLADFNQDNQIEINISLWKKGSYGKDLPFWLEENTKEWGNHLFVYGMKDGKIKPVWCSSTLDAPIKEMIAEDINGDNKSELITLEGNYDNPENEWGNYLSIWSWNDWGFFNDYRSAEGKYFNLSIEDIDNNELSNKVVKVSKNR